MRIKTFFDEFPKNGIEDSAKDGLKMDRFADMKYKLAYWFCLVLLVGIITTDCF